MSKRFGAEMGGSGDNTIPVGKISSTGGGGKNAAMSSNGSEIKGMLPIGPYGVASTPPSGLMAYAIMNYGGKDGFLVYDPGRPSVNAGDITLYNSKGAKIELKGNNVIITCSGTEVIIGNGDIKVNDISVTEHKHKDSVGGETDKPH